MVTLGVILIHNGDEQRLHTAREAITQFSKMSGTTVDIAGGEVSYQEDITPASIGDSLLSWFLACRLEHRWKVHLRNPQSLAERRELRRESSWWCRKNLRKLPRRRRRVSVVAALTAKNIRAWERALDERWDYLLVVEDDVILSEGSSEAIKEFCAEIGSRDPGGALFGSLAEAVDLDDLGVSHLVDDSLGDAGSPSSLVWFTTPVSNTAAAYVLSRGLVLSFYKEVRENPWLRRLSADWLLNSLFLRLHATAKPISCLHARDGVFVNRSILGQLPSQTKV